MEDESGSPKGSQSDNNLDQPTGGNTTPVDIVGSNGIAKEPSVPTIAASILRSAADSDSLASQQIDVALNILKLPHTTIPRFAASLHQKHQFDYSRLASQMEKPDTDDKDTRQSRAKQHRETMGLAAAQATGSLGLYQFYRTVGLSFMRKSLGLGYHHATLLQTLNRNLSAMAEMLESKLEAIKLNTAAPDEKKTTLSEKIRADIKKKASKYLIDQASKAATGVANKHILAPARKTFIDVITGQTKISELLNKAGQTTVGTVSNLSRRLRNRTVLTHPEIDQALDGLGDGFGIIRERAKAYTRSEPVQNRLQRLQEFVQNKFGSSAISKADARPLLTPEVASSDRSGNSLSDEADAKVEGVEKPMVPWWTALEASQLKTHKYLEKIIELIPRSSPPSSVRQTDDLSSRPIPNRVVTPLRDSISRTRSSILPGVSSPLGETRPQAVLTSTLQPEEAVARISRQNVIPGLAGYAASAIGTIGRYSADKVGSIARNMIPGGSRDPLSVDKIDEIITDQEILQATKPETRGRRPILDSLSSLLKRRESPVTANDTESLLHDTVPDAAPRRAAPGVRTPFVHDTEHVVPVGRDPDPIRDIHDRARPATETEPPQERTSNSYGFGLADLYDLYEGHLRRKERNGERKRAEAAGAPVKRSLLSKTVRTIGRATKQSLLNKRQFDFLKTASPIAPMKSIIDRASGTIADRIRTVQNRPASNEYARSIQKQGITRAVSSRIPTLRKSLKYAGTGASLAARAVFNSHGLLVDGIAGATRAVAPELASGVSGVLKGSSLGRNVVRVGKLVGGIGRVGTAGLAAGLLDNATDLATTKGSFVNRLGHTASKAVEYAAIGSFFGPVGTAVGAGLGVLVANLDLLSKAAHGFGHAVNSIGTALSPGSAGGIGIVKPGSLADIVQRSQETASGKSSTTTSVGAFGRGLSRDKDGNPILSKSGDLSPGDNQPVVTYNLRSNGGFGIGQPANASSGFSSRMQAANQNIPGMGGLSGITGLAPALPDKRKIVDQPEYKTVFGKLSKEVQAKIAASKALQFVVWSTAIQSGPDAAAKIIEMNFADKESDQTYIRKIYQDRTTKFADSSTGDRVAAIDHLGTERAMADSIAAGKADPSFAEAAASAGHPIAPAGDATIPYAGGSGGGSYAGSFASGGVNRNPTIGKAPPPPTGSVKDRAKQAVDFYVKKGWTPTQASGIVASLMQESSLSPSAKGDSGLATGLAQWHPDRQALIAKHFGKPVQAMSYEEQLDAVNWELTEGQEKRAGNLLRQAGTAAQAGDTMSRAFERPRDVEGEASKRSAGAVQIASLFGIGQDYKAPAANDPGTSSPSSSAGGNVKLAADTTSTPRTGGAVPSLTPFSQDDPTNATSDSVIARAMRDVNSASGVTTRSPLSTADSTSSTSGDQTVADGGIPTSSAPSLLSVPKPASAGDAPVSVVSESFKLNSGVPHSTFNTSEALSFPSSADVSKDVASALSNQNSLFSKMLDHLSGISDNTSHLGATKDLLAKNLDKPNAVAVSNSTTTAPSPAANNDVSFAKTGSLTGY